MPLLANPAIPTQVRQKCYVLVSDRLSIYQTIISVLDDWKFKEVTIGLSAASGVPSMSKAKSQTFDPFADLGNLGSNLPSKTQGHFA